MLVCWDAITPDVIKAAMAAGLFALILYGLYKFLMRLTEL